jgi:hypothetical protein
METTRLDELCREISRVRDEDVERLVSAVCTRIDRRALHGTPNAAPQKPVGTMRLIEPRPPRRRA